ncbi:chloride channel protein [Cellulomonas sp. DKR-3]|uniref:Chloride channel protein n=1 Tax=Cellulomonas fulva TaxID=2835530 RepID=A0ABS5TVY4_9CELL|nr:chloride channel protein [Cellulomonas fulva]MBT0993296.1 chloride channel protein [Cellulomonas fulva]
MTDAQPARGPANVPPRDLLRLTLLGLLVGLPAGLVAFAFFGAVHWLEQLLWDDLPEALGTATAPWYLVLGLPMLGGVLVHLARMLPGDGGHSPIEGMSMGAVRPRDVGSVALAALATLPFGLVLGPEAPLIALGAIVGTWVTRWAHLKEQGGVAIGVAGSGAAMSTLFGGPLVAGLMLLEGGVGAGALVIPLILPALAASAMAYLLITGLGEWSGLPMPSLALPDLPTYESVQARDLLVAVVVGVLASLAAHLVRSGATVLHGLEVRTGRLLLLVGGGLAVGLLALLAQALGADAEDVLFSGQSALPHLVGEASAVTVLVLVVAKGVAYAVSMGAGFRGGPIFPAVFLGVGLATLGVVAFDMSVTVAVAMGTAAGMTAMTRMVVSPLLFAGLLVGRPGLEALPVAVLATTAAWLASAVLDHRLLLRRQRSDEAAAATDGASSVAPPGAVLPAVRAGTPAPDPGHPTSTVPGAP